MVDPDTNSPALLGTHDSPQPSAVPIHELSQLPRLPSAPSSISADLFAGWQTIHKQRNFYNEQDCLDPSHNLASEKLNDRNPDDVVIFDYSLAPGYLSGGDEYSRVKQGGPPPEQFGPDDDIFFRVPKNELIGSRQFNQIINPIEEPRLPSRGQRLGVM